MKITSSESTTASATAITHNEAFDMHYQQRVGHAAILRQLGDTEEIRPAGENESIYPLACLPAGSEVLSASEMYALYAAFLEKMQAARIQSEEEIIR